MQPATPTAGCGGSALQNAARVFSTIDRNALSAELSKGAAGKRAELVALIDDVLERMAVAEERLKKGEIKDGDHLLLREGEEVVDGKIVKDGKVILDCRTAKEKAAEEEGGDATKE